MRSELDDKLKRFEERIEERKPEEKERELNEQEELRQSYLRRTKRKDLTP